MGGKWSVYNKMMLIRKILLCLIRSSESKPIATRNKDDKENVLNFKSQ
jgi:hypothetical protein